MGQKVNPISLRLGINKTWDSRWYTGKDFSSYLEEDLKIRKFVIEKFAESGVAKVEIERHSKQFVIRISTAKPGKIIGKQGKDIEYLKDKIAKLLKSKDDKVIRVDVFEVKNPEANAQLSAINIAQQLEKRISFRRAMKKIMQQAMKAGAKGIKVRIAGRLNGAEMARTEWYLESRVPLHTLRADIDYGFYEAKTTYGILGVKVWIFKGEIFDSKTNVAPSLLKSTMVEE